MENTIQSSEGSADGYPASGTVKPASLWRGEPVRFNPTGDLLLSLNRSLLQSSSAVQKGGSGLDKLKFSAADNIHEVEHCEWCQ